MLYPRLLPLAAGLALAALSGCHRQSDAATPVAVSGVDTAAVPEPEAAPVDTVEAPELPEGFVRLREVAPSVAQEIRYATSFNFVGEPIDGYLAPECILTEPAARALAGVARSLRPSGLGLKVYDCYRPQQAVTHFVRWANTPSALSMREVFYPDEPKGRLFSRGYIATRSGHSRGSTVDLTLVRLPASASVLDSYPDPGERGPRCDRPLGGPTGRGLPGGGRLPEGDFDMGTAYDCFSELSATDHPSMPASVRRNRDRLRSAMSEGGFRNYSKEWWHFTLRDEPHPRTYFDFPVE